MDYKTIQLIIISIIVVGGLLLFILLPPRRIEPKTEDKSDKILQGMAKILDILQLLTLKMKEFEERLDDLNRKSE